jgi:nitrate reductase NapD
MVIAGCVVQCHPTSQQATIATLATFSEVETFGDDGKGNIVTVIEAESSAALEKIVKKIEKIESVLTVGLTYLNMEDEAEQISRGEFAPDFFSRQRHKEEHSEN